MVKLHAESREAYIHLLTTGDNTWEDYTMELDVKPLKKTWYWRYHDRCAS